MEEEPIMHKACGLTKRELLEGLKFLTLQKYPEVGIYVSTSKKLNSPFLEKEREQKLEEMPSN